MTILGSILGQTVSVSMIQFYELWAAHMDWMCWVVIKLYLNTGGDALCGSPDTDELMCLLGM